MSQFVTGEKTRFHKWYHDIGYLLCLAWGHNTFAAWYNDLQVGFDHCRRCERYNDDRALKSFHLWARLVILRVNIQLALSRNRKIM
jgi:hypothetical protein